jgi:hypothetical protein
VKVKIPKYPPLDQNSFRESFISLEEFPVTDPVAGSPRLADSSLIISRSQSRWLATAVSLVLLFSQASCHNIMVTKYKPLLLLQDSHQSHLYLRELDPARKMEWCYCLFHLTPGTN